MNIEELKLIVEMVSNLGDGAREVAIVWLLVPLVEAVIVSAAVLVAVYWGVGLAKRVLKETETTNYDARFGREMRDKLVPLFAGSGSVCHSEAAEARSRLHLLMQAEQDREKREQEKTPGGSR